MVPKDANGDGTTDVRFWVSVGSLLLAIIGTWMALSDKVTANTVNIKNNSDQINLLRGDLDRRFDKLENANREILMELRK